MWIRPLDHSNRIVGFFDSAEGEMCFSFVCCTRSARFVVVSRGLCLTDGVGVDTSDGLGLEVQVIQI